MSRQYREAARHVASEIYNHQLPATAEEFLDSLEPLKERCFELLPCFHEHQNLGEIFDHFSDQAGRNVKEISVANDIYHLGLYEYFGLPSEEKPPITPNWMIVSIQNEAEKYHRYFRSFQEAIEFIVQTSLAQQFFNIVDNRNSANHCRIKIEQELAVSWTLVQWHRFGGAPLKYSEMLLNTLKIEGLQSFKPVRDYIFQDMMEIPQGISLAQDYFSAFAEFPVAQHLNKPTRWQWFMTHLP